METTEHDAEYVEMGGGGGPDRTAAKMEEEDTVFLLDHLLPTRGFIRQWRAFRAMAWPYFSEQATGCTLCGVMILLTLLNSAVRVVFSYLARDFWTALGDNEPAAFYTSIRQFLIALIVFAPISVLYRFQRQKLAIHWREWMTERVLQLYATNSSVYYGLERSNGAAQERQWKDKEDPSAAASLDNPDQRITEDVRSFTQVSLTLFLTVLTTSVDLVCFSVILFTILPKLFLAILAFATAGTFVTVLLGRSLIQLNFERLQKEAHLRFALVRLREYAEQIAFLGGETVEKNFIRWRLSDVIHNMHDINRTLRNLEFFTTYYAYLTWILPMLVIAPAYFAGEVELGVFQQAAVSFSHVLDDMSILITQWDSLSEFSAGIDRLYTFLIAMQQLDPDRHVFSKTILSLPTSSGSLAAANIRVRCTLTTDAPQALVIRNLTLTTPVPEQILFENLNVELKWGDRLLITGSNGVGKSSLLRAVAGLWKAGRGEIDRPPDHEIYFVPQKPYCCTGTLRDQLLYPHHLGTDGHDRAPDDTTLLSILQAVELEDLLHRHTEGNIRGLDTVLDWSNTLSLGEQQRLAFARVLVHQPRFIVCDEATSAMDVASEARMYRLLTGNPVTYVSVGHRDSLRAHHNRCLELKR